MPIRACRTQSSIKSGAARFLTPRRPNLPARETSVRMNPRELSPSASSSNSSTRSSCSMAWIKRNLGFVIGSVMALALMGIASWYLYSQWQLNNETFEKLNADYEKLRRLNSQPIHPGSGNVNNIEEAKKQQKELRAFIGKTHKYFQRVPPIPDIPKVADRDFSTNLSRTIDQLAHEATNSSVTLPSNYSFTFQTQKSRLNFAPGSTEPLSTQLGEIKVICDVLFQAKINALDMIRRERVSPDDSTGNQTDYLSEHSVTNELAVLSPYDLDFRCFSSELASVLAGFASSPSGLIVKSINVEAAPATAATDTSTPMAPVPVVPPVYAQQPVPINRASEDAAFRNRYGVGGPRRPPPQSYAPAVPPTYTQPMPGSTAPGAAAS